MTDWKYEELIDSLKLQKKSCENYLKFAKGQKNEHKSIRETDDKYEIMLYNYWRGAIYEVEKQVEFLKSILKDYEEMMLEDIKEDEMAEEEYRKLKHEASLGI